MTTRYIPLCLMICLMFNTSAMKLKNGIKVVSAKDVICMWCDQGVLYAGHRDGSVYAYGKDYDFKKQGETCERIKSFAWTTCFDRKGIQFAATCEGRFIRIYKDKTCVHVVEVGKGIENHPHGLHTQPTDMCLDGRYLMVSYECGHIGIFDIEKNTCVYSSADPHRYKLKNAKVPYANLEKLCYPVALRGTHAAYSLSNGTVSIIDMAQKFKHVGIVPAIKGRYPERLQYSNDGTYLSISYVPYGFRVYNMKTNKVIMDVSDDIRDFKVCFGPSSKELCFYNGGEGQFVLYDLQNSNKPLISRKYGFCSASVVLLEDAFICVGYKGGLKIIKRDQK